LRELFAKGAAYQVIGVARDTRGSEFDGSDSKQIYLPLPEDRLPNYSILIQTQSEPAQVIKAIDPVISSMDPDLVISPSTLDEILRRSPPFIASRLAAAVASTLGLLGLLLASMGIYRYGQLYRRPPHARNRHSHGCRCAWIPSWLSDTTSPVKGPG
jgi:hypothetical protein